MTVYRAKSLKDIPFSGHPKDAKIFGFCERNQIRAVSYKDYRTLYYALTVERIHVAAGGKEVADRNEFLNIALACVREDDAVERGSGFSFYGVDRALVENYNATSRSEVGCASFSDFVRARLASGMALSAILNRMLGNNASKTLWDSICKASYIIDTLADLKKDISSGFVKKMHLKDFTYLGMELAKCSMAVIKELGLRTAIKNLLPSTLLVLSGGLHSDKTNKELSEIEPVFAAQEKEHHVLVAVSQP